MKVEASRETARLAKVLKPLGRAEARRAIKTAVQHLEPRLTRNGRSRYRVLGAQLGLARGPDKGIPQRLVEVFVIDYLNRRRIGMVVAAKGVAEVRDLDWQPAFSAGEIEEAEALAKRDERLRKLVGRRGVFISTYSPAGNEQGERKIGLRFLTRRRNEVAIVARVEVDLMAQRVIRADAAHSRRASHG